MAQDKTGVEFDPTIHFSGKNGGVITNAGTWRKRSGSKKAKGSDDLIAKLLERIEALESRPAAPPPLSALELKRLQDAQAELESLRPNASQPLQRPTGPRPALVPYSGFVRAKENCIHDTPRKLSPSRIGGTFHEPGDVFEVSVSALWTDSPYEPVNVLGAHESGAPIVETRTDVPIIDWRFRVSDVSVVPSVRAM